MVLPLLAAAAPALAAAGPVGWAVAGLGAVASIVGGITARSAAKARARALEAKAAQARQEGGIAAMLGLEDDERQQAHALTQIAADGGGNLSAGGVLDDLQRQSVFKARSTVYRAQGEANNAAFDAKVALQEGRNAMIKGGLGAASSLLGGFADAAKAKASAGKGG